MNILILREADIHRACTMPEAIDAACEALRLYSTGVCDIPLRTTIAVPEGPGSSLYMYGYAAPAGALGVKIVSSFPENAKRGLPSTPSTMVLLDAQAGAVCALLDGTYFTRLRTGALAGAATRLLRARTAASLRSTAPADRHSSRLKPSSRCGRSSGCRS